MPRPSPARAAARACRRLTPDGELLAETRAAIDAAVAALAAGQIVAVQATGGFQLWVDATRPDAVARLRERKHREAKPLAVMVARSHGSAATGRSNTREEALLASPAAPIVLVAARADSPLAPRGCARLHHGRPVFAGFAAATSAVRGISPPGGRHQRQPQRRTALS